MKINNNEDLVSLSLNPYNRNNIKEVLLSGKKINMNFFKEMNISEFQYQQSKIESNNLILSFSRELFLDFILVEKLINEQKHTFELLNYLINTNMEWLDFKKKMDYKTLINKMKEVKYNHLSKNKFNYFLNRIAPSKTFPRFIPLSLGFNHIFKWVKTQIIIYIYLINSKKIQNIKLPKIKLNILNYTNNNSTNNIINQSNTSDKTIDITLNYSINNQRSFINSSITKSKKKKKMNISSLIPNDNERYQLKTNILSLNNYDEFDEKIKTKKLLNTLPLVVAKDYNEMREFYNKGEENVGLKNNNINEIKVLNPYESGDKIKIISMLSNNKIGILSNLEQEKINEILG